MPDGYVKVSDIIEALTMDNVEDFIRDLGITTYIRKGNEIVMPTVCHNNLNQASSMKLYWYHNNKIFHCYTECGNMSIFEFYMKFMELNAHKITFGEAVRHIKNYVENVESNTGFDLAIEKVDRERYTPRNQLTENKPLPKTWMEMFRKYYHPDWLREGISREAMDIFNIRYSSFEDSIIIPHYDVNGNLIGIRCREMTEERKELYGKYHPYYMLNPAQKCNHKLSTNLYGVYENKKAIKTLKRAIVVEGEKSCLLDKTYVGEDSVVVACCGHSLNIYQVNILTKLLGVTDITIAFDKEYQTITDNKAKKDRQLLQNICRMFESQASFSYIWDYDNLLNEKDSPFDKGKDIWNHLYKMKVRMN